MAVLPCVTAACYKPPLGDIGSVTTRPLPTALSPIAAASHVTPPDRCGTPAPLSEVASSAAGEASKVVYESKTNTIRLRTGAPENIPALAAALKRPDLLHETAPGEWLLRASLHVERGAVLHIAGPEVSWLKLRSDREGFVAIKALGGRLYITATCVSSWDAENDDVDRDYDDGRSFVLARDGAYLQIAGATMRHLGYLANESYGVSLRLKQTSGRITDSELAYNFYGLYTFEASDLLIQNNQVHHSVRYGIDPHTRSNRLLIEGNTSYGNGKHGIILAEGCDDSIIRNNTVFSNTLHGIVVFQNSNNNLVESNTSYGNGLQGINVNDSSDNIIRNNLVYDNRESGIGLGQKANQNLVEGNTSYGNLNGIYLFSGARNTTLRSNVVSQNRQYGIYIKSGPTTLEPGNRIADNGIDDVVERD